MNSDQNDAEGSQEPPNEQTHTNPRLNVIDVAFAGVSLALFTLLVGALILFGPLDEANRDFVTIYCAVLVLFIASPVSGQVLHVELDAFGLKVRAIGGIAAFVIVLLFPPGAFGPQIFSRAEEPNAIHEEYFRVFGGIEATTLIRILATPGRSLNDPITSDEIGWCPDFDVDFELWNEDYMEAVYNGWCALAASNELLESFRNVWKYPEARIVRTDLVERLTDDPKMAQALLFQGNSFSVEDQKCLLKYVLNRPAMDPYYFVQKLDLASDADHDVSCQPNPSRRIGFLGLVLTNEGDEPIDSIKVFGASLRFEDRPIFKDLYGQEHHYIQNEPGIYDGHPMVIDRNNPDLNRWSQFYDEEDPKFGSAFKRKFETQLAEGGYHQWVNTPSFEGTQESFDVVGFKPGDSIIILIGAYEANDEGFEREPLTDIFVPQTVEYSLGGDLKYTERLREPKRDDVEKSRIEFDGEWGWVRQ